MEETVFFFKITGVGLEEPIYAEITVNPETGYGEYYIDELKAGKYTVEEIDIQLIARPTHRGKNSL